MSTIIDTQTTNSQGKTTLTDSKLITDITSYSIDGTNVSVSVNADMLDEVTCTGEGFFVEDEKLTGAGKSVTFVAKLINSEVSDLSGYQVKFSGGVTANVLTNNDGEARVSYAGTGKGKFDVYVDVGMWNAKLTGILDVLQYWDTKGSINKKYYTITGQFQELSNYYKLTQVATQGYQLVGMGDGQDTISGNWKLSFDVVNATSSLNLITGLWNNTDGISIQDVLIATDVSLKPNDTITIYKTGKNFKITKNHTDLVSYDNISSDYYPFFGHGTMLSGLPSVVDVSTSQKVKSGVGNYLSFNNLRFMKV